MWSFHRCGWCILLSGSSYNWNVTQLSAKLHQQPPWIQMSQSRQHTLTVIISLNGSCFFQDLCIICWEIGEIVKEMLWILSLSLPQNVMSHIQSADIPANQQTNQQTGWNHNLLGGGNYGETQADKAKRTVFNLQQIFSWVIKVWVRMLLHLNIK